MLRASAELYKKYQDALTHAGMGLWEMDIVTKNMAWDEGYRRLFEKDEGQYEGVLDVGLGKIHDEDRDSLQSYFRKILTDDSEVNAFFRITTKKQETKYIRATAYRIKKDGKLVSFVGICRDVTIESLLQIEVSRAKEFTENILNAIPDPIFVKNEKHEVIYANSGYENLVGKEKNFFIGKNDFETFPKDVADICWQVDSAIFKDNISRENEEKVIDAQGRPRDLLVKKTPLSVSSTQKILVGVIHDITDLKKIQNSLVEQSKMASLGEMASEIAHEINNPLMIIQGKSQLLLSKIHSQQVDMFSCQKDLAQIEANCVRIDKIIKSLKSVSRKADQDPFENASVLKLIDEAFEISKERFRNKRLNLFVLTDEFIDYTYLTKARASEIVQVLVNLLNNSYDAIQNQDKGWARINLSLSGKTFYVEVTDSGAEIEPEVAKKMMEPFFTTKSTGKGTGLGLSVSRQIIQNHNGELYYDPKGNNTRFVFTLPKI